MDPPYHEKLIVPVLELIHKHSILTDNGLLVVEHPPSLRITSETSKFDTGRELKYGDTILTLLQRKGDNSV